MLLGLRTVVYKTPDLAAGREWYAALLGLAPYFDEPFYVGFDVGGFELGLDPDATEQGPGPGGATAYWGVSDLAAALAEAAARGAAVAEPLREVGGGIKVAALRDPFGNLVGLIENPHFGAPPGA
jgi:predicted enzyme related to lactoylglutathione lyase